jgi:hypothetical protein
VSDFKYESVTPKSRDELRSELESNVPSQIASALYSASRYNDDWEWVQHQCLRFLTHASAEVRWAAATCLGDLAFFRRPLDSGLVIPALQAAVSDPLIADPAKFSLSMVKQFCSTVSKKSDTDQ